MVRALRGNHVRILRVPSLIQVDAEEARSFTDACADGEAVLPDPPANTSVFIPSRAAAREPIHFFT